MILNNQFLKLQQIKDKFEEEYKDNVQIEEQNRGLLKFHFVYTKMSFRLFLL